MSDPVSNVEIEDVLSSIRRLVSTDHREPRGQREAKAPIDADRLVLTPSLRVEPADKDEVSDSTDIDTSEFHEAPQEDENKESLSLRAWQVEDETPSEHEPEQADELERTEDEGRSDLSDHDAQETEQPVFSGDHVDEFRFGRSDECDPETEEADDLSSAEAWLDDEPAANGDALADLAEDMHDGDEIAWQDSESADEAGEEATDAKPDVDDRGATELEARIAEVEAAVAAREDEWEPDGDADDAYAGASVSPLPWADHTEDDEPVAEFAHHSEPLAAPQMPAEELEDEPADVYEAEEVSDDEAEARNAAPETEEKGGSAWYGDDAILDEEALRDLVSDIVRQELQGALGERITRNVRKLVRREIHRALMSQDFD